MLGLSAYDILASLSFALAPFLAPKSTSERVWSIGTERSCTFLGFLSQMSFAAIMYNAWLAYYYLFTVRLGMKRQVFARRFESAMHISTFAYFFFTGLSGVFVGFYGEFELGMGCYVKEYPDNCFVEGGCVSHIIAWVLGGIPLLFTFLSLPIINMVIYFYVRNKLNSVQADGTMRTPYQIEQIREVASQGVMYVVSFYLAYFPAFVVKAAEGFGVTREVEGDWYWLMILNAVCPPLQGLFNAIVYLRPNWKRLKRAYPGQSTLWYLQEFLLDITVPTLASSIQSQDANRSKTKRSKKGSDFSSNLHAIPENSREEDGSGISDSDSDTSHGNSFADVDMVKHGEKIRGVSMTGPFSEVSSVMRESVDQDSENMDDEKRPSTILSEREMTV